MEEQNYKSHVRYYIPHHFVFYPVVFFFIGVCIYFSTKYEDQQAIWIVMSIVLFLIAWLSYMLRQHYALMNQDRIVRLELRFRYYLLTKKRLEEFEHKLSLKQLLALRFASDEELPELIEEAADINLSSKEIKQSIKKWNPDYMRV
jgi:amino acid permease